MSRDHMGPGAVINALGRIVNTYGEQITRSEQELQLARQQLTDYEARSGESFVHETHNPQLRAPRDQLKFALSVGPDGDNDKELPNPAELTRQIKELPVKSRS